MALPTLFFVSLGGYLALHYFILPRTTERWHADRTSAVVGKAVTLGVMRELQKIALVALIAVVVVYLVIGVVTAWAAIPRSDYASALRAIGDLREGAGWLSTSLGTVTFVLLSIALVYLAGRRTKRGMQTIYDAAVQREIDRLRALAEAGNWEVLEPTPQMREVETRFAEITTIVGNIPADATDRESRLQQGEVALESLQKLWVRLDWARRISPNWQQLNEEEVESDKNKTPTKWERLRNTLLSKGMFRTTRDLASAISNVGLVLLFLSLMGLQAAPLRAAIDGQAVHLSQLAVHKDKEAAIQSALASGSSANPVDTAVVNELARHFELAFANSADVRNLARAAGALVHERDLRESAIRRRILDESVVDLPPSSDLRHGEERAEHLTEHPSLDQTPDLGAAPREELALLREAATDSRHPRTYFGRDLANEIGHSPITRTRAWAALERQVRERRTQFGELPGLEDVGGDLTGEVLEHLVDAGMPEATGEVGELVGKLRSKAISEAIKSMYEVRRDAFLADIARGVDVHAAVQRVLDGDPHLVAISHANQALMHETFADLPTSDDLAQHLEHRKPRLRWDDAGADHDALNAAIARAHNENEPAAYREMTSLADNFSTYEDYFPAQTGVSGSTSRSRIIEEFAGSLNTAHVDQEIVSSIERSVTVGDELVSLAADAEALGGYFRVGGVIIGQTPNGALGPVYRDIEWERQGTDMSLWLVAADGSRHAVGRFPAATVHQALAYAADDRRVAATMTPAELSSDQHHGLRVLLHPALVDTPLGNDVLEIDRFVDTYVHNWSTPDPSPAMRNVREATQVVAHANELYALAQRYRLAAIEPDSDEKEAIDSALSVVESDAEIQAELRRALKDAGAVTDPRRSPLTVKTQFYDSTLVDVMVRCVAQANESPRRFGTCVQAAVTATTPDLRRCRIYPPAAVDWSGVREERFSPDTALDFLHPHEQTAPLRFMLQVAFKSPPHFGKGAADEPAFGDSLPWEYPDVAKVVHAEVARRVARDLPRAAVLGRVQDFVVLQRLFRSVLVGALGDDFPSDRLIGLARETHGDVRLVRTPRWNRERGSTDGS